MVDLSKINIKYNVISLEQLVVKFNHNQIRQQYRNNNAAWYSEKTVWDTTTKSQYIESLILKHPTPFFYFDLQSSNHWEWTIIDGLERLEALGQFVKNNAYNLQNLNFLPTEFDGKYFSELPRYVQRSLLEYATQVHYILPPTSEYVKQKMYQSINSSRLSALEQKELSAQAQRIQHTQDMILQEKLNNLTSSIKGLPIQ